MTEEPNALPEQDGHKVDAHLVDQAGLDALLRDVGSAYADVPVPGDLPRQPNGAFDAVGDEGKRRAFVDPSLG